MENPPFLIKRYIFKCGGFWSELPPNFPFLKTPKSQYDPSTKLHKTSKNRIQKTLHNLNLNFQQKHNKQTRKNTSQNLPKTTTFNVAFKGQFWICCFGPQRAACGPRGKDCSRDPRREESDLNNGCWAHWRFDFLYCAFFARVFGFFLWLPFKRDGVSISTPIFFSDIHWKMSVGWNIQWPWIDIIFSFSQDKVNFQMLNEMLHL